MTPEITTSMGTTIQLVDEGTNTWIVLDHPDAPPDMRSRTAGRVIDGGFQPEPFAAWAMSPEALRGIAALIDRSATPTDPKEA